MLPRPAWASATRTRAEEEEYKPKEHSAVVLAIAFPLFMNRLPILKVATRHSVAPVIARVLSCRVPVTVPVRLGTVIFERTFQPGRW